MKIVFNGVSNVSCLNESNQIVPKMSYQDIKQTVAKRSTTEDRGTRLVVAHDAPSTERCDQGIR